MKRFVHGGAVARTARELGVPMGDILDFSASINPLGVPDGVLAAARESLLEAVHYPEIDAASLRGALAAHHGLPAENLLPGSGSTELLYLLPQVLRPRRALLVTPAFSEYERAFSQAQVQLDFFPLCPEDGFQLDPDKLLRALPTDTDLILLANPGNPSGAGVDPEVIETLARQVREQAVVAVDEAFVDFCPRRSVLERVAGHGNLYVFRSLTKFYAIPGLRAGYLAGPARGIARLAAARLPWSLSTPALAAASACLAEEEYRRRTLAAIPRLRDALAEGLIALGMRVFPGEANYLLARLLDGMPEAAFLADGLRPKRILIRDCADFPPLDGRYLRVAVRSAGENRRLLQALGELLS
ncbi:MAG: threonine-phosphate decarboxylase [Desulfuromonadaceae bacterium GWC2_58_13]|nr:MAG: threonine-phosphate decarboxylase [Desulfuromonadaceae bacterium GWC2_58_13]